MATKILVYCPNLKSYIINLLCIISWIYDFGKLLLHFLAAFLQVNKRVGDSFL